MAPRVYVYVLSLTSLALGLTALFYVLSPAPALTDSSIRAVIIFGAILFILEIYEVELVYKRKLSTGIALCLAATVLGGGHIAIPITILGTLFAECVLRWDYRQQGVGTFIAIIAFNVAQFTISAIAALGVYLIAGGTPLLSLSDQTNIPFYTQLIPTAAAFLAFELVNSFLVAGVITLTQQTSLTYHLKFDVKHLSIQFLALGAVALLLPLVYVQSPWNLIPALVPLGLVYASLRNYMHLRYKAKEAFETIMKALSERDPYTFEHSHDAADLAAQVARQLKLPEDRVETVESAAAIHDIGKIGIPDEILNKPAKLTDEEWEVMKKHPDIGANLIKDLEMYEEVAEIIRCEHEKWDGTGYPRGLRGEEIPLEARIVAIADIYNALITDRPYRDAFSHEKATQIIEDMRDSHLDSQVVDAFLQIVDAYHEKSVSGPDTT